MQENYLSLLILAAGFLVYFLIILYGPRLFDLLFYPDNQELKERGKLGSAKP